MALESLQLCMGRGLYILRQAGAEKKNIFILLQQLLFLRVLYGVWGTSRPRDKSAGRWMMAGEGAEELLVVVVSLFRLPDSISLERRCTEIGTGF